MTLSIAIDTPTAFAAIALAAVSWDGVLTKPGSRALRHALDYRLPFRDYDDEQMVRLMNDLMSEMRRQGPQHLMVESARVLTAQQRDTAYAVATEIMRSDGPLEQDELNILHNLSITLGLDPDRAGSIHQVMDLLHADISA